MSQSVFDDLKAEVLDCARMLMRVDSDLAKLDALLHSLQPLRPGRITLRWVKDKGRHRPILVKWYRHKSGESSLWYYRRIGPKCLTNSASRRGEFFDTHKQVKQILHHAGVLLSIRKGINLRFVVCLRTLQNYRKGRVQQDILNAESYIENMWNLIKAVHDYIAICGEADDPDCMDDDAEDNDSEALMQ